jgi:predicted phage terminase large subunit-like protein
MKHKELGYNLCADSRSAGEWETTNGGRFFCAGVNAGIAGHRADLGLIDDPIGTEEDAYSDLYREKVKDWYLNDFWPRLKPGASQILICNRRHEDDLAGWLMATQPEKWKVIKIPFFAQADDPLGRLPGERLWPEWFTEDMAETIRHHPNRAGLYDQDPHPEDGDFFKKDWIESAAYRPEELPHDLIHYVASDFAVSLDQKADFTCHLPGGVDENGVLWILPDIFWKQAATDDSIEAMLAMMKRRRPQVWWAEKGHISKSIGPFLTKRMREEQVYTYVEEVTPARDKRTRAQSIRARMKCGMVRWPTFAHWFPSALAEMLAFDSGKHDDFVDALAHLGMGLDTMISANKQQVQKTFQPFTLGDLTLRWLKQHDKRSRFSREMQLADL